MSTGTSQTQPPTTDPHLDMMSELIEQVRGLRHEMRALTGAALTREGAAAYLGISVRNLHDLVKAGKVKRVQISDGRYGFRREELDRYLSEQECKSEADTDEEWFQKVTQ